MAHNDIVTLVVCLGVPALVVAAVAAAFWRYGRGQGLRSFLLFRPCRLLSKETLVEGGPGRFAVRRFRFALPGGALDFGVDFAAGEYVKVRAPGFLPKSRSYSPVATRPGEFDLIVKIYPVNGGGKRAGVSSYLDTLEVGDDAHISGPYPPPLVHIDRCPGRRVGIVAYGVGITEAMAVAEAELPRAEVVLLWALRDQTEAFAHKELEALRSRGLKVHYHFSRERGQRIGPSRLREVFDWAHLPPQDYRFLVVGTKAMAKATRGTMIPEAGLTYTPLLRKRFGVRAAASGKDEVDVRKELAGEGP